jgi:hypothetical protein
MSISMTAAPWRPIGLTFIAVALCATAAGAQELKQTAGSNITVTECYPHRHTVGTPAHPWIDPYGMYHDAANFPYT